MVDATTRDAVSMLHFLTIDARSILWKYRSVRKSIPPITVIQRLFESGISLLRAYADLFPEYRRWFAS